MPGLRCALCAYGSVPSSARAAPYGPGVVHACAPGTGPNPEWGAQPTLSSEWIKEKKIEQREKATHSHSLLTQMSADVIPSQAADTTVAKMSRTVNGPVGEAGHYRAPWSLLKQRLPWSLWVERPEREHSF